ncbi:MAG: DoxX family protein [candidate division KSB1 bacterium]|nr:DoxX family protein [candidate division KSB1 bacterium]MDZ7384582.1 DoxX family protein [candidate division KSB1 bacterium]MDZ7392926.1 DoxX family protein [candidate division KSB1 bacterium]MDZ7414441.1 DoxX family protein [candidate division KSB1 bacterium]
MMQVVFLVGRIVVGVYYLFNAINHFAKLGPMSAYAASKGIPAAKVAVVVSGLLLLVAGLSFLTGYRPTVGVVALVIFLVPVTFSMHAFWKVQDPMVRMSEMINFTKNLALLGSSLMFLAIRQPWPFSLR